jgi:hypothetical protein
MSFALDRVSTDTLKRFARRLGILALFALAQIPTPWGFTGSFAIMALTSAMLCASWAVFGGERLLSPSFTYWDEALAFALLAALFHFG